MRVGIERFSLGNAANHRFFIPLVPPNTKSDFLKEIIPYTSWIGFNIFELKHSMNYQKIKDKGIKDAFGISDKTKVFLSTTAPDTMLEEFYSQTNWFEKLNLDVQELNADWTMGPDWFSYRDDSPEQRMKDVRKAQELNLRFVDYENIIPTIRGNYSQEISHFIKPFKNIGKKWFVFTGREYLINKGKRKRGEFDLLALTSYLTRKEKVKLVVTGSSSPRQQEYLSSVSGFVGQGWLIQANRRMLIVDNKLCSIFDKKFACFDNDCCGSKSMFELAEPKNDVCRSIHNLKRINEALQAHSTISHYCLEVFNGLVL